jgi:hypothetical protein
LSDEDVVVEKAKEVVANIDDHLGHFIEDGDSKFSPLFLVYVFALMISRISGGDKDKMHLAADLFDQAMEMAKRSASYAEDKRKEYRDG